MNRSFPRIQLLNMNQAAMKARSLDAQYPRLSSPSRPQSFLRATLIYEVRGKTRDYPRKSPQSPPMGPDLTDAPGRLAGRAQICILSGRTTSHISEIVSEGEDDPIHKMPLKGFKLARVARQSPSFTLLSLAAIRLVSLHAPFVFYLGP